MEAKGVIKIADEITGLSISYIAEQTNLENTYPTLYILNTYKKQKDSIYERYIAKLEIMFLEMQKDDITQERFYELIKRTKKIIENGKNELSRINELEQSAIKNQVVQNSILR